MREGVIRAGPKKPDFDKRSEGDLRRAEQDRVLRRRADCGSCVREVLRGRAQGCGWAVELLNNCEKSESKSVWFVDKHSSYEILSKDRGTEAIRHPEKVPGVRAEDRLSGKMKGDQQR